MIANTNSSQRIIIGRLDFQVTLSSHYLLTNIYGLYFNLDAVTELFNYVSPMIDTVESNNLTSKPSAGRQQCSEMFVPRLNFRLINFQ